MGFPLTGTTPEEKLKELTDKLASTLAYPICLTILPRIPRFVKPFSQFSPVFFKKAPIRAGFVRTGASDSLNRHPGIAARNARRFAGR